MDEGIFRQRRNLMIISIVLFLISVGGISIDHEISILGAKLKIENPLVIYIIIWAMYAYFFIRYFQYYYDLDIKFKDYWPNDYDDKSQRIVYNTFSLRRFIFNIFLFVIKKFSQLIAFSYRVIAEKNFSDYFFPLVFALFAGWVSCNTVSTQQHKDEAWQFLKKNVLDITVYKAFDIGKEEAKSALQQKGIL